MNDPEKRRPRRKLLWLLLLAAFLFPGLALGVLILDEAPPDTSDLRAPDLPRADNAYFALAALGEALNAEDAVSALLLWEEGEGPFPRDQVARALERHEAELDRLSGARRIQVPTGAEPNGASWPFYWLQLRARIRAEDGQGEAALGDAMAILEAGEALRAAARSSEAWFAALRVTIAGSQALNDALARVAFSDQRLAVIDRRLAEQAAAPPGLARALLGDAAEALDAFEGSRGRDEAAAVLEGLLPFDKDGACALGDSALWRLVYKPERTRRRIIERLRSEAEALDDPQRRLPPNIVEERGAFEELMSGNLLGRRYLREQVEVSDLDLLRRVKHQPRVVLGALRLRVSLARFRLAEGRLPKTLEELQPRFLDAVPEDLDGRPIRYRPDLELIYSVGEDLEDDGASSEDMVFSFRPSQDP